MNAYPLSSVIIPACNFESSVDYYLESLLSLEGDDCKVVVVEGQSHDSIVEIVKRSIGRNVRLRLVLSDVLDAVVFITRMGRGVR